MKTIGILGGLGPESTLDYYREIIATFNSRSPELAYPEILIYSVNLNEFMALVKARDWDRIADWLLTKIEALQRAGADFAAIASNTPHIVFETLQRRSPLPLLSIVEETARQAERMGLRKPGLMGTRLTMESDFYQKPFLARGMAMVVPGREEQELIHHRLFSEIELGIFKDATRDELLAIVQRMVKEDQIDSLILGCTELPLILTQDAFGIPFLNTSAIHCQGIVKACMEQGERVAMAETEIPWSPGAETLLQEYGSRRLAVIYHLRIREQEDYRQWLEQSLAALTRLGGRRCFRMHLDPAPRESLWLDEIVIDEYPSARLAQEALTAAGPLLADCCEGVTVLALEPEPALTFRIVRLLARCMHFFRGIHDKGALTAHWKGENAAVWPDQEQMRVARLQDPEGPLLVYNLNKNNKSAQYEDGAPDASPCSGAEAYERYSRIAGEQLLRRGAYPVYGGRPLGFLLGEQGSMLADNWDKFILVHYPKRRTLLGMIESEAFAKGQHHRDAGLERVAVFMGRPLSSQ